MSLTAIATVAITLFLCGLFWVLVLNINLNATVMESSVEVKVFLADDVTSDDLSAIEAKLKAINNVSEVTFVSKDEGLKTMSSSYGDSERVIEALDENPLPDSYTLKAATPQSVAQIAEDAKKLDRVQEVRYGQGTVENLFAFLNWVRSLGLVVMVMMAISALVLIVMNIRVTVTARKEEIEVMKYVGASNAFVSWPFILEGIILSLIGSLIAIVAILLLYDHILGYMTGKLLFLVFLDLGDVWPNIVPGLLGAGVLLGAVGSFIALRRFLKV